MSTIRTRPRQRFRPAIEAVEARLCLSGMAPHAIHHAVAHFRTPHATPHRTQHGAPPAHNHRESTANTQSAAFVYATTPVIATHPAPAPTPTVAAPTPVMLAPTPVIAAPVSAPPTPTPSPVMVTTAPPTVVVLPTSPVVPVTTVPVVVTSPAPTPVTIAPTPTWPASPPSGVSSSALNASVLEYAQNRVGTQVSNGECAMLVLSALQATGAKTNFDFSNPNGDYTWGQLAATLTPQGHDLSQVRPGDILQFRDAKFVAPNGDWSTATHHTAIVEAVSGDTITVLQSNINGNLTVQQGTYKFGDMTQGTIWDYHPVYA